MHQNLCGYSGVVAAGIPQHALALHAVPGLSARFRAAQHQRVRASSMALVSAWPRWSEPVTLGGGITIVKLGVSGVAHLSTFSPCNARQWNLHKPATHLVVLWAEEALPH